MKKSNKIDLFSARNVHWTEHFQAYTTLYTMLDKNATKIIFAIFLCR